MKIKYYFSITSPFAYLGTERFTKLVRKYNVEVIEKPLDLVGNIFPNTGGLPIPKRHPARQKYRLLELIRIANKLGLPINKHPKFFPPKDPHLPAKFLIASNNLFTDSDGCAPLILDNTSTVIILLIFLLF